MPNKRKAEADAERMRSANYELSTWEKEGRRAAEDMWAGIVRDKANSLVYDPGEKQRIPKSGAWIMITRRLPPMEFRLDEKVRVGCVYWATHDEGTDAAGFNLDGQYKVKLTTPWGDVWLWPYEYSIIEPQEIVACWAAGELLFHATNMDPNTLNAQTFYARSRGISLADATVMALGTLSANVGWFEIHPDLRADAEAMEERVHRWKPRRRTGKSFSVELTYKNDLGVAEGR